MWSLVLYYCSYRFVVEANLKRTGSQDQLCFKVNTTILGRGAVYNQGKFQIMSYRCTGPPGLTSLIFFPLYVQGIARIRKTILAQFPFYFGILLDLIPAVKNIEFIAECKDLLPIGFMGEFIGVDV